MKFVDKLLQKHRFRAVRPFLPKQLRLIDVGTHEGEFFDYLGTDLSQGYGLDPLVSTERTNARVQIVKGHFPERAPAEGEWDAVSLLAVLEHIPPQQYKMIADGCHKMLRKGGLVVITVPSPRVDLVLGVLRFLRLVDGMSLEQHHGFEPARTGEIFSAPRFELQHRSSFQLGLNNIFVFRKT